MKRKLSQLTSGPKTLKPITRMREYWPADRINDLLRIYPADHRDVPTLNHNLSTPPPHPISFFLIFEVGYRTIWHGIYYRCSHMFNITSKPHQQELHQIE